MAKQIKDFLNPEKSTQQKKPEHKIFFLDDTLDNDPTKICPGCESSQIKMLPTQNMDGIDYGCNKCKLTYEIIYCNRGEDIGH